MDGLGFSAPVVDTAAPVIEEPIVDAVVTDQVVEGDITVVDDVTPGGDTQTQELAPIVNEPIKETVYVDPFAELGDTERSIFESIKNKDYASLKSVLDAITADYDNIGDLELVRQQIKQSKPRWSEDMINAELTRKYGVGIDEEEMTPAEKLSYQMALLDDGDAARDAFKSKQGEIKFPELTTQTTQTLGAEKENVQSPEEMEKFRTYWNGHIDKSVKDLTDEVMKIEVGKDGSKEVYDFPISITDGDKQGLKALVSEFDINKDFQSRYVKGDEVDLKKFMADRFKADNFDKLVKAAFAQGFSKGTLKQIAGDKNLSFDNKPQGAGTHDQVAQRTTAAAFFLSNGRNR